jgi:simple sugar transport system ATP-binding protein
VLFVSHKLREVAEISDRVVVLRRGRLVGDRVTSEVDDAELAGLMMGVAGTTDAAVGLPMEDPARAAGPAATTLRPPVLSINDLSVTRDGRTVLDGITLSVGAGEIIGIAGISGNGQTDLVSALCGLTEPSSGLIEVDGVDVTRADTASRLAAGLGRLTEDRRGSVVPQMSVEYNLVLEDLPSYTRRGMLDRAAIRSHAETLIERFDIRATPGDPVATLSGGNMQKVLLARALARQPRILVVAQPTRGLDIGAYRYVHSQLRELRENGAGVLLISEDLDELHALCDRIAVLFRGEILGELPAGEASSERLGVMMTGGAVA